MTYINITKFVLINESEKDLSMIKTCRLKNVVIFIQTVLMKILNDNQIQYHVCYIFIYLDQYSQLIRFLCINILTKDLVYRKYINLLLFDEPKCYFATFLVNNARGNRWWSIKLGAEESSDPIFLILLTFL